MVVTQIFCAFIGDLQQVTNIFDMTTDYKVTELFCIIDEFCKHFEAENAGNLLEDISKVMNILSCKWDDLCASWCASFLL